MLKLVNAWRQRSQGWWPCFALLALLASPSAIALPEQPEGYLVAQVACATACSDAQLAAARQTWGRQRVQVSAQTLDVPLRACLAGKRGAEESNTARNLTNRWTGLSTLSLPDDAPMTVHTFACDANVYTVIEMDKRRQPLFVVTPDGALLLLDMPRAAMAPPPPPPPPSPAPASPPPPPPVASADPRVSPVSPAGDEKKLATVRVFFGTSRAKVDGEPPADMFGGERGELVVGELEVSLPPSHLEGDIEQPKWWRFEFSEDPDKHMVLQAVTPWPMSSFRKNLQEALAKDPKGATFLFVHGFNVTFKEAAMRTAQMAWDLQLTAAPMMFSWPSQGKLGAYAVDEDNVEWSVPHLKTFMREVAQQQGAKKIHVIAHSMGNRALVQALQGFERPNNSPRFNQIILAAADIDADVFKEQIAPGVIAAGERVTIYASDNDKALKASKKFHGNKRVGDAAGFPLVIAGMDTVDASAVDTNFLGHSYFADEKRLLNDMRLLVATGAAAAARKLKRESNGVAEFWSVR